ncbi:MAG: RNA polymerase sigma factor [Clostridia bacterium]
MKVQIDKFEKIYNDTYNRTLKYIVVKCNNIEDVNDIMQDTYLELLNKIKRNKLEKVENIENYILGIASNIIKRHYTKKKKENIISYDDEENSVELLISDDFDLEENIITKENVDKIWSYIKGKELIIIKIFYLYYGLGLKISEIAQELEIGESNIKNKIYRTLKELKKYLGEEVNKNG